MKTLLLVLASLFSSVLLNGCAIVQNLRDDIDEPNQRKKYAGDFDFTAPENRNLPPPPASVEDERTRVIAGTPVDYSGIRAKSGRITKKDFLAEAGKNENSLWSEDGQNNYLFARNQLKAPGDLITIKIEDDLRRDMVMEVKKLLPPEYRDRDISVPGLTKDDGTTKEDTRSIASTKESQDPAAPVAKMADEDTGSADSMTAEILERYPNGNLRVRAVKRIPFKRKVRNMDVVAIVRGSDIDEKDVVKSSKLLEHKAELYK